MSVVRDGSLLRLEGRCRVEDAELVAAALQGGEITGVDLSGCEGMHAAVAQALMVFSAPIFGEAADLFVRASIAPALAAQTARSPHAIDQLQIPPEESK